MVRSGDELCREAQSEVADEELQGRGWLPRKWDGQGQLLWATVV